MRVGYRCLVLPLLVFAFINTAWAQSRSFYFPRVLTPSEMFNTGLAFVNPIASEGLTLQLEFSLLSIDGTVLQTKYREVWAGGQLSLSAAELFPNETRSGWIRVGGYGGGVQGFWLGADFTDGALAAPAVRHGVLTFLTADTEISIANTMRPTYYPTDSDSVTLTLYSPNGAEVGRSTRTIHRNGSDQLRVADIFPAADFSTALHMHIESASADLAITSIVKGLLGGSRDTAVINAMDGDSFSTVSTLNFPHVVSGSIGNAEWTSLVGVTNLSSSNSNVTFTFTEESGATYTMQRMVPPKGSLREDVKTLLNLPSAVRDGWMSVSGPGVVGFLSYADRISGGVAVVPVQDLPRGAMLFPHVADLAPWYTGIALLNTSDRDATVEVYAITPTARRIGSSTAPAILTLPARSKRAFLLSEKIPATQLRNSDGGFIYVRSTNNVFYGMELFFLRNQSVLANIAGAGLPAGYTYNPPTVETTPSQSSNILDQWLEDTQGVRQASFRPGDRAVLCVRFRPLGGNGIYTRVGWGYAVMDSQNKTIVDSVTQDTVYMEGTPTRRFNVTIPSTAVSGTYTYEARVMEPGQAAETSIGRTTFTVGGLNDGRNVNFTFTNNLYVAANVTVDGASIGNLAARSSKTFALTLTDDSFSFEYSGQKLSTSGYPLGLAVEGGRSVTLNGASSYSFTANAPSSLFFLRISNTGRTITNIIVNEGLEGALNCNCQPAWMGTSDIGYFTRYSNTNVIVVEDGVTRWRYGPRYPATTPQISGINTDAVITLRF